MRERRNGGGLSAIAKFMLSIREESFRIVLSEAQERGVSVQELVRAVIIPEWVRENLKSSPVVQLGREARSGISTPAMSMDRPDPFLKFSVARTRT